MARALRHIGSAPTTGSSGSHVRRAQRHFENVCAKRGTSCHCIFVVVVDAAAAARTACELQRTGEGFFSGDPTQMMPHKSVPDISKNLCFSGFVQLVESK